MTQLTLMLIIPDRARADISLSADRIYYRFATDDAIQDGSMKGLGENADVAMALILERMSKQSDENSIDTSILNYKVFIDNSIKKVEMSEQSLRRLVHELQAIDEDFAFLTGFLR